MIGTALLLAFLAPSSLGCAPTPGTGTNATNSTISSKGTFSMVINPPVAWTTGAPPKPPQAASAAYVERAINTTIQQAVKTVFYERQLNVDTVTVKLDPHNTVLDNVNIVPAEACATDKTDFVADSVTDPTYIVMQCVSDGATPPVFTTPAFTYTVTGSFDTAGLSVSQNMWDALAVSLQNTLAKSPFDIHFASAVTVTPST